MSVRLTGYEHVEDAAAREQATCVFLRTQAAWLTHGLERADDPTSVGIVLARHDVCHEHWLDMIAHLDGGDEQLAGQVATLYAFHGRIVGCLERGPDQRLGADVRAEVRRMLSRRLAAMTDECIASVGAAARARMSASASASA
jgi:hypothetical protein